GDLLDRLADETLDQYAPRLCFGDAAGAQIEQRRFVEVADAGAVAALDVVGIDFEFGLGVDDRAPTDDQVARKLMRVSLLGVLANRDRALEGAMAASGRHPFDQLVCLPAR